MSESMPVKYQESAELFRLLVESVRDYAIFVLDPEGHVLTWNPGAERIKGWTAPEIVGRHFSNFYPEEDKAWDKPGMELRVASKVGRFEDEGWRIRKDGTSFWANVIITALRDETGTLVGFAKVTRDLTERRAAEQRAIADARRVAQAEASNRAKSEFLAAMSHELRTPLNAIGGYVDLLAMGVRGPVSEEQHRDLERIRSSQKHLLAIINDLLNFSRIESGRLAYDIEPLQLGHVLAEVQPMIGPQAMQKQIELTWPEPDAELTVSADAAKLQQILLNLLSNAVKFTPSGGRIAIGHDASDDDVCVTVADTGVGIPAEQIESIFEPFVQLGRGFSSPGEGTGLGLAISRDLARAMRGDITVRSTVGRGSIFTLKLPRAL